MSTTVPPIIAAIEAVNAAYRNARRMGGATPTKNVEPALMIAAHTRIADALDERVRLCEVELHADVELNDGARMPLVLADPVKFWALQRSIAADRRDSKAARELADWWAGRPSPKRRRRVPADRA